MRPETVRGHHRVGFFGLGGVEGAEGVGTFAVFKQRVFHGCTVNRTQQRSSQDTCNSHHVEGIERPVVEPLQEEDETEDGGYPEAGCKEPARLSQGVH
ncbi:hypothetical protein MiSe_94800 [Microseira wollei NIES-4236]|uniref:Uncharacterized protein n=1 Tax=Microseira wollei NIES-4236 TaxID=2530354 RepID=A0AAV3WQW9_9CYAN|nr:hypothetical protein MiSe_94800 [Microseira wollei NIES-4236]